MQAHWEHRLIALAGQPAAPAQVPFFSYWAGDATLQRAYDLCGRITSRHSKSFHLASGLLPEAKRASVRALYAFCRTVDDIVDEGTERDRTAALDYWRDVSRSASAPDGDPVAAAWADTLARHHIPRHFPLQLIDGVGRDLSQSRYESFDDLATYCYGVASTVGLMSMYIIGFRSHEAVPHAIKLGVALQMTNILRDIGEDFQNGRVYLPAEERYEEITKVPSGAATASISGTQVREDYLNRGRCYWAMNSLSEAIDDFDKVIQSEPAASCDENERRSATRFPIERPVSYKYARGRTWSEAILGKTLNISSTGVLFFGDTQLIAGKRLQLSISWPVQLDGRCSLKLVAVGSVVRCAGNIAAARIE